MEFEMRIGIICFRYDWFQTDEAVNLMILKRSVELSQCSVAYANRQLIVRVEGQIVFEETLSNDIDKDNLTVKCTNAKVGQIFKRVKLNPKNCHGKFIQFVPSILFLSLSKLP